MVARTGQLGDTKILIKSGMHRNEFCVCQTFEQGICHIPKMCRERDQKAKERGS